MNYPKHSYPVYDHIVVVIEENRGLHSVINNLEAIYMNYLANNGTLFTNFYHSRHPSQPNYIELFSGNIHGVTSNDVYPKINSSNLYTALKDVGKTFVCYSEDLPYAGYEGEYYNAYVRKHNPSPQFTNVPSNINQPFSAFPKDYNQLPDVSFVVPNQDNNAHDGTLREADIWLYKNISNYAEWARNNNSLLIIVFDEPETNSGDSIPVIFYGAHVLKGENHDFLNHRSLLKYILDTHSTSDKLGLNEKTTSLGIFFAQ